MKINVNDRSQNVSDDYRNDPLVWTLRDELGLTGTHYGCGIGVCGSCMVLIDGQPTRSCQIRTDQAANGAITTIEGLAKTANGITTLHHVQQAFLEFPLQCMWCLPGHVMTAVALIEEDAEPTPERIDEAMSDNLCRCGGYNQIRQAVASAAERKRNS